MADVRGEGGNQDTTEILRYAQNDRLQYRATEPRGDNLETTFRLGSVRRTQGRPFDAAPFGKLRVNRAGRRRYRGGGGREKSKNCKTNPSLSRPAWKSWENKAKNEPKFGGVRWVSEGVWGSQTGGTKPSFGSKRRCRGQSKWGAKKTVAMGREKPYKNRPFAPVLVVRSKPEPTNGMGARVSKKR